MNIFLLEDDPTRIRQFKMLYNQPTDRLTAVTSSIHADQFKPPYDLIFLDHDLGGRQLEDHEDCGLAFVKAVMDKFPTDRRQLVVIHSYNHSGAAKMDGELAEIMTVDVIIAPFGSTIFNNVIQTARAAANATIPAGDHG